MTYHDHGSFWKGLLLQGLADDDATWDWTTQGVLQATPQGSGSKSIRAQIVAKSGGIWAAEGLTAVVSEVAQAAATGGRLTVTSKLRDGDRIKKGDVVCEWRGDARSVLTLERPYLNLATYACGIATQTHELVEIVKKAARGKAMPRVTPTRKILPHYRDLAIAAVQAGGGRAHRVSLSGGVLIKENHIEAAGSISRAVTGARDVAPHGLKIEVEVKNLDEVRQALEAEAEALLLDNFSPAQVKSALTLIAKSPRKVTVEVSGGLTAETIGDYVMPGVDVLSVGALTHTVRSLDLSLLVV